MHMKGTPRTMQDDPVYDDVVAEVRDFLAERIAVATSAGIDEERIWLDPGIGFGKTVEHNLELIARLGELADLGRPIVIGASRKNFIGAITGREVGDRLGGSIATNVLGLAHGADVLRVHDVAETIQAVRVAERILGRTAARRPRRLSEAAVSSAGEPVRVELVGLEAFGPTASARPSARSGGWIVLDISFTVPDCTAVGDDELEGTVDYGAVATPRRRDRRPGRSCRTLEHLCGLIADEIGEPFESARSRSAPPRPSRRSPRRSARSR